MIMNMHGASTPHWQWPTGLSIVVVIMVSSPSTLRVDERGGDWAIRTSGMSLGRRLRCPTAQSMSVPPTDASMRLTRRPVSIGGNRKWLSRPPLRRLCSLAWSTLPAMTTSTVLSAVM